MSIPIGLSTASVWPLKAGAGFELAADLGYDGVEVMVWVDPVSQDVGELRKWSKRTGMPVLSVHSPSLLITQRVWSPDPVIRLRRSVEAAQELGARTVVVHPPFRWQRRYGDGFADLVAELEDASGVAIAVENMFKVRPPGRNRDARVSAFRPSIDPTDVGYRNYTLDLSHTAAAGMDPIALAGRMGAGLTHVHLADGTGVPKDEHLVPGRGGQPCAELLELLLRTGFDGQVVLEINTRRAAEPARRVKDLAEALLYARLHLGQ
ncbi:sugar phosphate isomerase/epimerase family protein [Amycolatopsis magusensis]|uniref:Sugar phosphate isomerase/epimerase n=1 Tax=Amycolatopsis magusensis TaxID=882444 RepID=A0ABS4PMZ7_9PSEU|nr:sugar phosphate isomerase/epimerase family protein [Amycolatopsis magusensis]MBP2180234.1 sugar phosphate isomerase/epimerase [Amycolatopsis magusensis]MDI5981151.1 sugar phosphate isomerase/epimerase family protein [Amycolatopsis magusensis]UJW33776.1 sugar phosphate isomerase/epimerase [Saccharothrix sp. AJ9571]